MASNRDLATLQSRSESQPLGQQISNVDVSQCNSHYHAKNPDRNAGLPSVVVIWSLRRRPNQNLAPCSDRVVKRDTAADDQTPRIGILGDAAALLVLVSYIEEWDLQIRDPGHNQRRRA